jgi:hypothetical protein
MPMTTTRARLQVTTAGRPLGPELAAAVDAAIAGRPADLYRRLELASGLPGPKMNLSLALDLASHGARLGAKVDPLAKAMAELPPDEARGASGKEFLSVCGVLIVGARAMTAKNDAGRDEALALFEAKADDPRFRVREAIPIALAMLGSTMKEALAPRVAHWMDRYFQAAAVILALADPAWLETFPPEHHEEALDLLHAAFLLAHEAPRSAARYPGHKALVEALTWVPGALAKRFGVRVFDRLGVWADYVSIPEMRDVILANLDDTQLKKPFRDEIASIKKRIEAGKKPPRDPTRIIQGMRGRGKKRGRG